MFKNNKGRLIDPTSSNNLAIAFNPEANDEETTDEEIDEVDEENAAETQESDSNVDEENLSQKTSSSDEKEKKTDESDIECEEVKSNLKADEKHDLKMVECNQVERLAENCGSADSNQKSYDSICESGFSENESKSLVSSSSSTDSKTDSSIKRKNNYSNGYYTSENEGSSSSNEEDSIKERVREICEKDVRGDIEEETEKTMEIRENINLENQREEIVKETLFLMGSKMGEPENSNQTFDSETENLKPKKSSSSNTEINNVVEIRENLLRTKIFNLPLSTDIKMFLLYNRDI